MNEETKDKWSNEEESTHWENLPEGISSPKEAPEAPKPVKEAPKLKILWKAVEPRHYLRAQEKKTAGGKTAYVEYIVSLVERLEGEEPKDLTKAQEGAIVAAFEEKFGEKKSK